MTAEVLAVVASGFLSLLFEYIPGFKNLFDKLEPQWKSLSMLGLITLVLIGAFLLSCYGPFDWFVCTSEGIWEGVAVWLVAIGVNQGVHNLIKPK